MEICIPQIGLTLPACCIEVFVSGKYTHDRPFMADQARSLLGDCVETDVPEEVYSLMDLYRMEAGRSRPGVEYVPLMKR